MIGGVPTGKYLYRGHEVTVINLNERSSFCCLCGKEDLARWGVPVDDITGAVVANDYEGEWGGKPACEECWKAHEGGAFVGQQPRF
jgi:hypothetical protein